jgi:hypothetical protein
LGGAADESNLACTVIVRAFDFDSRDVRVAGGFGALGVTRARGDKRRITRAGSGKLTNGRAVLHYVPAFVDGLAGTQKPSLAVKWFVENL